VNSGENQKEFKIEDVIGFYHSNRKEKNVRKDTKDLLIQYLNDKYSDYQPPKKGRKKK
jgi:hypothetical protein